MDEVKLVTKIAVCRYEELSVDEKRCIEAAKEATRRAYAPFSKFQVGCALLLSNDLLVQGSNQENVAFPSGLCAERVALFTAQSTYPDEKVLIAAVAARNAGGFTSEPISPCGACRQVLLQNEIRYHTNIRLLLYGEKKIYRIDSAQGLLPLGFSQIG